MRRLAERSRERRPPAVVCMAALVVCLVAACGSSVPSPTAQPSASPTETPRPGPLPPLPATFDTPGAAPDAVWQGISWTDGSSVPARSIEKVVRWRKGFVALLRDPSLGLHLYASSDGGHWQSLDDQLPYADWRVVESPAGLLALEFDPEKSPGELGSGGRCASIIPTRRLRAAWASADGFHWQKQGPVMGLGDPTILGLAGSDSLIVAVACTDAGVSSGSANSYSLLTSTDGTNWLPAPVNMNLSVASDLLYGRGRFLLMSAGLWSSADGQTWTKSTSDQEATERPFGPARIEVASGGFLGFDPNFGGSWRSTDGITWHISYEGPFGAAQQEEGRISCPGSYGVGDGYRFVAYGRSDFVYTSLDGQTWAPLDYAPQPAGLDAWNPYDRSDCNRNRPLMLMPRGLLVGNRAAAAYGASN